MVNVVNNITIQWPAVPSEGRGVGVRGEKEEIEGRKRKGEPQRERKFGESDTEGEGKVGQKMGRKESSDSYTYSLVPRLPNPVFLQWEEPGYEAKSCTRVGHMAWNILCVCVFTFSHAGQHLVTAIADKEYGYKTKSW